MDDLDPTTVDNLDDLAACLRVVHLRADKPTYRALEQQTVHANEILPGTRLKKVRLTRSILSDVLLGRKFPGKAFMLTFLDTCGIDLENDARWEQAWDRLAGRFQEVSPLPEEVEKLRQESAGLRQQLTTVLAGLEEVKQELSQANIAHAAELVRVKAEAEARIEVIKADKDAALRRARADAADATKSPAMRQRELAKQLRELRINRDLTIEDVAKKLLCSATKISRLETGTRRPSLRDVRDLSSLYEVDEATAAALMELARGAREQSWWTQYDDFHLDPYIGLEQNAAAITSVTTGYIPGLLQTEDYAKAIINSIAPKMDPAVVMSRVEVRMRRQQVLQRDNRPRYHVLLDEAVFHRAVGGRAIMAAQLTKILETTMRGRVTIQVIPFKAGTNAAPDSNFVLLEFEDGSSISPIVFVEGLTWNLYIEKQPEITRYREAIDNLRGSALNERDSLRFVTEMIQSYFD